MAIQSIRRSQFITTYGPGSIIETPNGPRIIPNTHLSGIFDDSGRIITDFEIADLRLSELLPNNAGIFRIPSNAEVGLPDEQPIYNTFPFPKWAICTDHSILYSKISNDNMTCPECTPSSNPPEAWRKVRREAIRFIRACSQGHLDDVFWPGIIQHATPQCNPEFLLWEGGGGALRHIDIRCPDCNQSINLGIAYSQDWPCSGKFPEQSNERPGCSYSSKILQRGAANLYLTELQSALTIPPRSTSLHRILESSIIRAILAVNNIRSKEELLSLLGTLHSQRIINSSIIHLVNEYSEEDIISAINDTMASQLPESFEQIHNEEFDALIQASIHGAPAVPSSTPGAPNQFEVILDHVRNIPLQNGQQIRITPVNRLRVVMVQLGYRRLDPRNNLVDMNYYDGQRHWYPGMEMFGEGIFIHIPNEEEDNQNSFSLSGDDTRAWKNAWRNFDNEHEDFLITQQNYFHPMFVWWHTLSHRLINALAIDSGYSSASISERIYVDINNSEGTASGGILLYTAQPGGDGTLGGLVSMVPHFENVLYKALYDIESCSNDPLCGEERFSEGRYNGAACYACLLLSETSCSHRNMNLDRNLLTQNPLNQ